jgi:hypothetical protein
MAGVQTKSGKLFKKEYLSLEASGVFCNFLKIQGAPDNEK